MASKYNISTEGETNNLEKNGQLDDGIEQWQKKSERDNTELTQINESFEANIENISMESPEESQTEYEKRIEQMYHEEIEALGMNTGEIEEKKEKKGLATFMKKKEKKATDFSKVQLHNPTYVCTSESHKIIFVSTKGDSSITMLDLDGQCKGKITSKELKSPWGIAIKDDTIYVTDIEAMSAFSFSITQRTVIETSQANFVQPRQLAINCANEVWVADDLGNVIVILDEKLTQIETIKDNDIKFPMDIKFTYAQACILSRNECNVTSVHIFDQNSRKNIKMIIRSNNNNPIYCHFFHILEHTNLILIPDSYSKSILIYDLSGENKGTLDTKIRAIPLCLDVLDEDIYILYKLDKAQLKRI